VAYFFLTPASGAIFIIASIAKIQDIPKFVSTVVSYGYCPILWLISMKCGTLGRVINRLRSYSRVFIRLSAALLIPLIVSFMVASSYALANAVGGLAVVSVNF